MSGQILDKPRPWGDPIEAPTADEELLAQAMAFAYGMELHKDRGQRQRIAYARIYAAENRRAWLHLARAFLSEEIKPYGHLDKEAD